MQASTCGYLRVRLVLLLALAVQRPLCPQANFGRISGAVSDSSGAVLPKIEVRVVNEGTSVERAAHSNEDGAYLVTNLPVGIYTVKVEVAGFQAAARTSLNLVADGRLTVDFVLQPAGLSQSVDVVAARGEAVNLVSGELARVVDMQQVQDLALNGRNYGQLVDLIPGSALLDEDQLALTTGVGISSTSINGSRTNSTLVMVDGSFNLDAGSNGSQFNNVSVDFIREVNIKTSNFSAEYGRQSGASVNVITRSGSNQFHGAAFEFLRNETLDARNFFSPQKAKLRFNDFGWALGGPLVRNKLFFFGGQEWKRIRQNAAPRLTTLPTHQERQGNFNERGGNLFLPGTTTPAPNRNLSGMITADGRAMAKVFDRMEQLAASYVDTPTANNAVFQLANPFDWRQDLVRIDYIPNRKQSIYGRYVHDMYNLVDPVPVSGLPTVPINRVRPGTSYQLTHTWTISPSLINEARGTAAWHAQRRKPATNTWERGAYGFVFPQIFNYGPLENSIPAVTIQGFTNFQGATFLLQSPSTDISLTDNLTWIRGNHAIKAGVLVARNRKDQDAPTSHAGNVAFSPAGNPLTTANAFADALLGNYRTYAEASDDPVGLFRFTMIDGYIQDNWRINRRLSFEFGLRLQHNPPWYSQENNVSNFDPRLYDPSRAVALTAAGLIVPNSGNAYNGLIRAGSGVPSDQLARVPGATSPQALSVPTGAPRGLFESESVLLAPRFSFAWSPVDNRTAIRGGFGMFYDHPDGNIFYNALLTPPYVQTVQFENGNLANPSQGRPAAQAPFGSILAFDPHLAMPYTMNYSLGIQREMPHGFLVEATYVGNLGRRLIREPDLNQPDFSALVSNANLPSSQQLAVNSLRPYKGYSSIIIRLSDSTSNYHALQLYTSKRAGDLLLTAGYTWSKALTDSSSESDNPENPLNRHYSYGPATFDRRHIFFGTYTYNIPLARNRTGPGKFLLAGWQLSGVHRFQTGPYATVAGPTSIGSRRADYVGGPVSLPVDQRSVARYFNTTAFQPAPNSRRGNSGVGNVPGPGMFLWDLSTRKEFAATETLKVRFQVDFFNLPNHANFRSLGTDISSLAFGSITAAGPARNIQFGLKVQF